MRLILCEKPSQGRDIAKVVGATTRGEGCLTGQGITVTWCVGHLLETAPPEHYDENYKKWALEHLPIIPQQWQMLVSSKTKKQFTVVKKLLTQADELVIATDADREGEMIARELIDYCGYKGKIQRLWLSALNDASIRKAFSELKSGDSTVSMYYSALTRSRSDWLIGMNLSRLFTLLGRQAGYDGVLSVGRVQTPTLNLVVKRDREIKHFIPKPYWTINVSLKNGTQPFVASWCVPDNLSDEAGRCIHQQGAISALDQLKTNPIAQVLDVQTERIKESPPLVFDLGTLQEVCSRKFGLGAQETLDIAQALYETHKATTYPRSDCGYLPESMYAEITTVLNALIKTDPSLQTTMNKLNTGLKSRVWNDKKITAHHGIIPTMQAINLSAMNEKERAVYELIRTYYLCQFMPSHEYNRTVVNLSCSHQVLKATGKQIVVAGWHSLLKPELPESEKEENLEILTKGQVLPALKQGDSCQVIDCGLNDLKTTPPKPYTEGELIKTMKGIARFVTDPRLKQKLKETTGIGTEATRAGIIQSLLKRGYLVKKGKTLQASDAANALIDAVPAAIIDPGMTALWEQALDGIEQGRMTMQSFLSKQSEWISSLIKHYAQTALVIKASHQKLCPSCQAVMKKRKGPKGEFWACSRYPDCKITQNINNKKTSSKKTSTKS